MPIVSTAAREDTSGKKHRRACSFRKLLDVFGKKGNEGGQKPKTSLRQRLSQNLDESFCPESWKSGCSGDFQTEQLFITGG
jgi:hypothetical protein